jgi:hypothetical protein
MPTFAGRSADVSAAVKRPSKHGGGFFGHHSLYTVARLSGALGTHDGPSITPLTISKLNRTVLGRNAGGRNAHRRTASSRLRCRSRLAVTRWDGAPGARSGSHPDPNWAIGNAAAGATSAHHRPSAAAPLPKTLHQVVCRAVSPSVPSGRRGVYAGAFPRRVRVIRW